MNDDRRVAVEGGSDQWHEVTLGPAVTQCGIRIRNFTDNRHHVGWWRIMRRSEIDDEHRPCKRCQEKLP